MFVFLADKVTRYQSNTNEVRSLLAVSFLFLNPYRNVVTSNVTNRSTHT